MKGLSPGWALILTLPTALGGSAVGCALLQSDGRLKAAKMMESAHLGSMLQHPRGPRRKHEPGELTVQRHFNESAGGQVPVLTR